MKTKTKRDKYRRLLERLEKHIDTYGNVEDVEWGNTMDLCVNYGQTILDILNKFDEIKGQK